LAMAGASCDPTRLGKAALVMIDFQNDYLDGALPLHGATEAVSTAADLLHRARVLGAPIIHIVHKGRSGGLLDRETRGGRIVDALIPGDDEPVLEKPRPNAFSDTDLGIRLARCGRKELIVIGFMTHMCVSTTVRAALDLGYRSTILASACATRALPAPDGSVLPAEIVQQVALAALADRFAIVANRIGEVSD